jgi:hypothetical protein
VASRIRPGDNSTTGCGLGTPGIFFFVTRVRGPDGKPADYSEHTFPTGPRPVLKIAEEGVKPGDLTFVVGYPGTTERLSTALEIEDEIEWRLPYLIALYKKHMDLLDELSKDDPDLKIKGAVLYAGLSNMEKKWTGTLDGAHRKDLVASTQKQEKQLQEWISSDANRQEKYGEAIPELMHYFRKAKKTRESALRCAISCHGSLIPS